MRRGAFGLSSLTTYRLAYANQYVKRILIFFPSPQFLRIYEDSLWPLASVPPLCYAQSTKSCPPPLARALFGGMSMQAVHLSGGALTLGLATALLCAGCAPCPPPVRVPPPLRSPRSPPHSPRSPPHSPRSPPCGGLWTAWSRRRTVWSASRRGILPVRAQRCGRLRADSGDPVTVTYTGALDPEEGTVSAVLLSITRDTLLNPGGRIHRWDAAVLYRPLLTSEGRASG